MANILSQDEIDDLLGAMERGELTEDEADDGKKKQIENFNFRRPNLIAGDRLRGFNAMHEQLVRKLQGNLTLMMRSNVDVNIASTDQIIFQEFVKTMDSITLIRLFTMEPLPGTAIMEIKLPLAYGVVDMLLGGQGGVETEVRRMTEIETAILDPFILSLEEQVAAVWGESVDVNHQVLRTESVPEMVMTAPSEAPMVVVTLVIKVGQANGIISIAYPLPTVQQLITNMDSSNWMSDNYYGKQDDKNHKLDIMTALADLKLPVSVDLGKVNLSSAELQELQVGDVLVLDTKYNDLLNVDVGTMHYALARPGRVGNSLSAKLMKDPENENTEMLANLIASSQA